MKKIISAFILSVLAASFSTAQDFASGPFPGQAAVPVSPQPAPEVTGEDISYKWIFLMPAIEKDTSEYIRLRGNNFPGKENALLKNYLTELYTRTEPITPGSPMTRIIIRKPAIFNAIKVIEKYYTAEVKKNKLPKTEAVAGFRKVLHVAVAAASENSREFEDALQEQRKDAPLLIGIFNQVKLKQM